MVPSKRQRSSLDDGETEVIEVDSAHASLRQETVGYALTVSGTDPTFLIMGRGKKRGYPTICKVTKNLMRALTKSWKPSKLRSS